MSTTGTNRSLEAAAGQEIVRAGSQLTPVIALHCSGADGSQWRRLADLLGPGCEVEAPSFIGCGNSGPWRGSGDFTLMDEASLIIGIVDALADPVHLVGHSYGGAIALKVASERPDRVASLSLYEPSAFHILRLLGPIAAAEQTEIEGIAAAVSLGLLSGNYQAASATFVDYWGGRDAWTAMRPAAREAMLRWLPKAPLDFRALLGDDTPLASYRRIQCPVLILQGEQARGPSRLISRAISRELPAATLEVIEGAGHMGPFTHAAGIMARIAQHIGTLLRPEALAEERPPAHLGPQAVHLLSGSPSEQPFT